MSNKFDKPLEQAEKVQERAVQIKSRLQTIINRSLTIASIDEYAEAVTKDLIDFVDDVTLQYLELYPNTSLDKGLLEDAAFKEFNLTGIPELLDAAHKQVELLRRIDAFMQEKMNVISEVITPPDSDRILIPGVKERYQSPELIPRLKTLLYIVSSDFLIDLANVKITKGPMPSTMMRQSSYVTVEIPDLNRIVQVCDEEGNASYVFDAEVVAREQLTVDHLNRMTKEEKNSSIARNRALGKRLFQNPNWRLDMSDYLSSPLADIEARSLRRKGPEIPEGTPRVSISELDPWKGFWQDPETGMHWGTVNIIAGRLHLFQRSVLDKLRKEFVSRPIVDQIGRLEDGYCFEAFLEHPKIKNYDTSIPQVESQGEWRGFYMSEGKHWGPVRNLARKLGQSQKYIEDKVRDLSLPKMKLRSLVKQEIDGYAYEDLLANEQIQRDLESLPIEKEGEWKGFHIDSEGHWGPFSAIHNKLPNNVGSSFLEDLIERKSFRTKMIGRHNVGYRWESIINDEEVVRIIQTPQVEKNGEWKGFYKQGPNRHFAPLRNIAKKIGIDDTTIKRALRDYPEIETMQVADAVGRIKTGYLFETIISNPSIIEILQAPYVLSEGEWARFYVDSAGKHWGSVESIADRLHVGPKRVQKCIRHDLPTIKIRSASGLVTDGYDFEIIEKLILSQ